jgi:hypothetical protein
MDSRPIESIGIAAAPPPFHRQPPPIIEPPSPAEVTKQIFLTRFKELLAGFSITSGSQAHRDIFKQRIPTGMNTVTRILEAAFYGKVSAPSLVVLTSADCGVGIAALAQKVQTPLLMLPGASEELGTLLGTTQKVEALAFLGRNPIYQMEELAYVSVFMGQMGEQEKHVHEAIDSFVQSARALNLFN